MADKLAPTVVAVEQETFDDMSVLKEDDDVNDQSEQTATTAAIDCLTPKATPIIPLSPELEEFSRALAGIIARTNHYEIWGVNLTTPSIHIPTRIILQKFLNANNQSVPTAAAHLEAVLRWRAEIKPLELLNKEFGHRFAGMAYVTTYVQPEDKSTKEVFSWNIYGRPEDIEYTCGDIGEYIKWLAALLELASRSLGIASANQPITADWKRDPYKIWRVDDAKHFHSRSPPSAYTRAWLEAGRFLPQNYPELWKDSFIVNVPPAAVFLSNISRVLSFRGRRRRSHLRRRGHKLAKNFDEWLRNQLPEEYGGSGKALAEVGNELRIEQHGCTAQ